MLGRPYSIYGTVVQGAQLGRTIGFPTANVDSASELLPADGVYAVTGRLASSPATVLAGVANVGRKPTVAKDEPRSLEAHFFSNEVPGSYGWEVEVSFHRHLRPERTFPGLEALQEQIRQDAEQARQYLTEQGF